MCRGWSDRMIEKCIIGSFMALWMIKPKRMRWAWHGGNKIQNFLWSLKGRDYSEDLCIMGDY